jgi:hypothetical protein
VLGKTNSDFFSLSQDSVAVEREAGCQPYVDPELFHISQDSPIFLVQPPSLGGPHGQTESGGRVLAVNAGARAPRGGVTRRPYLVLTDLQSPRDCQ